MWGSASVLCAGLAVAGCGRLGFEAASSNPDAASMTEDAVALDDTRCDELTGVLYCDGFEDASPLTIEATSPSFALADATRSYRGQRALHTRSTRPSDPAWWHGGVLGGITTGELHARWYVYVPAEPATLHVAMTHLVSNSPPYRGVIMSVQSPQVMASSSEAGVEGGTAVMMPRDRWVCMQLRVVISETTGTVEGWMDGALVARLTDVDTLPDGGYVNLHAGHFAQSNQPEVVEMWTDEMIVGTSSIPCD